MTPCYYGSAEEPERMGHIDDIRKDLEVAGIRVVTCLRLENDTGEQIRCRGGEVINVYDSGKVVVGGQNQVAVKTALGITGGPAVKKPTPVSRKVFVVYGHDQPARTQLEAMLLRWGLDPIILDQLPSEGATLIEKLERYLVEDGEVRYAVVLATPDDEGHPRGKPDEKRFRARQNVVLELGVLLDRLGRRRVAILLKDQANMERPSDIQGLVYIPFTEHVEDGKITLAKEMKAQGIDIDVAKL
jgi:predicted nucleotide-binding protein